MSIGRNVCLFPLPVLRIARKCVNVVNSSCTCGTTVVTARQLAYCVRLFVRFIKWPSTWRVTVPNPSYSVAAVKKTSREREIEEHGKICPSVKVSCTFAGYGCKWREERRSLDTHLNSSWRSHVDGVVEQYHGITKTLRDINVQLRAHIKQLEAVNKECHTVVHPNVSIHIGSIEWRLYHEDEFYSNPFYLDNPGYKARLAVEFHEDYVSVFNSFVSGQDDDEIKWPFQGEITVELVNGNGGSNFKKTIYYDKDTHWKYKTLRYHSSHWFGYAEFISVHDFQSYVKNDHVEFLVAKVKYLK